MNWYLEAQRRTWHHTPLGDAKKVVKRFDEGASVSTLAREFEKSTTTIERILNHHDRNPYPNSEFGVSKRVIQKILSGYDKGESVAGLAHRLELPKAVVTKVLMQNERRLRDTHEANGSEKRESLPLSAKMKRYILNNPDKSPSHVYEKFKAPMGQIVKFYVDNDVPFPEGYRRYVSPNYQKPQAE